jgi:hypothetical protein
MINWERQAVEKQTLETAEIKRCFITLYKAVQEKIGNHEKFIYHVKGELTGKDRLTKQFQFG